MFTQSVVCQLDAMESLKREFANDSYDLSTMYLKLTEVANSSGVDATIVFTRLILGVGGVACFFLLHCIHEKRYRGFMPPGPSSWPLVGSLFVLVSRTPIHETLSKLALKYGPVMFLRLGSLPSVVISSAEVAEVVLSDPRFSHRSIETLMYSVRYLEFDNEGFTCNYNEQLKLLRRLCTREIRKITSMEAFAKETKEDIYSSLKEFATHIQHKKLVCLPDILSNLGLNFMTRLLFGRRSYDSKAQVILQDFQAFKKALPEVLQLVGKFNLSDLFPALRWVGLEGNVKVYKKVRAQMEAVFKKLFQEIVNDDGDSDSENFVQFLLSHQLSERSVIGALQDLFIGGRDTFVLTTQWALAELVRNPDKLKRVQDEIDDIVGLSRPVQESDLIDLPYLRACVREVLRLYTPGPLLLPRETKEGFTFNGYSILPKTTVLVNAWHIGRAPDAFKNPDSFEPERWLESGRFSELSDSHFLAFGGGRRGCIGVKPGTFMAQITLGSLVHAFEWGPPPGIDCKDLDLSPSLGIFLMPKSRVEFLAASRLDPGVYNL